MRKAAGQLLDRFCVLALVYDAIHAPHNAPLMCAIGTVFLPTRSGGGSDRIHGSTRQDVTYLGGGGLRRTMAVSVDTCCRGSITPAGLEAALQGVERSVLELRVAEDWTLCCVCMDGRHDTLFFTCGHTLCAGCGVQLVQCPQCLQPPRNEPLRVL